MKVPMPQKDIQEEFIKWVKETYGEKEFPQFEAAELFFQEYFHTILRLNDFKNLPHFIKDSGIFEHTEKRKNPRTKRDNNYYKIK